MYLYDSMFDAVVHLLTFLRFAQSDLTYVSVKLFDGQLGCVMSISCYSADVQRCIYNKKSEATISSGKNVGLCVLLHLIVIVCTRRWWSWSLKVH